MRIVLTGASGQLGAYLSRPLLERGHQVIPWSGGTQGTWATATLRPVNLAERSAIVAALDASDPEVVLHVGALSTVEGVRRDPEHAQAVNVDGTGVIASWCRDRGRRLVFTSTDLVFDGASGWYQEEQEPRPVMAYGRSKAAAESLVTIVPGGVVARLSLLFGLSRIGRAGFFDKAVYALRAGLPQCFFVDEYRTPLDYPTAALVLVRLAESNFGGVVHVGGRERLSRFEFMSRVAGRLGFDRSLVGSERAREVNFAEPRPADVSLDTSKLMGLFPDLVRPTIEQVALTD